MPINFRISALVPVGLIVEGVAQLDDSILVTARAGIQVASCPLCGSTRTLAPAGVASRDQGELGLFRESDFLRSRRVGGPTMRV
jgi:hypothetical protein